MKVDAECSKVYGLSSFSCSFEAKKKNVKDHSPKLGVKCFPSTQTECNKTRFDISFFSAHIRISDPGQRLNKSPSTLLKRSFLHQSDPRLLPTVMSLSCRAAIPGIPPLKHTNRTPQNLRRTAKKATFLRQVWTKMTAAMTWLQTCKDQTVVCVSVCMRQHL